VSSLLIKILNILDTALNIPRVGWVQRGVPKDIAESVGEHELLTSYLTLIICSEARRLGTSIDLGKCLSMALIHDAHETLIGNVGNDVRSIINDWREIEVKVFESLGLPGELNEYFREYRYGLSVEGKLVNIADKLATFIRACKYATIGYDMRELINNYEESINRLITELPSNMGKVIQELITQAKPLCNAKSV
jgi:putative hydrolase of HD superfamily